MIGLGTLINTVAVVTGSAVGLLLRKGLKPELQSGLSSALEILV